MFFRFSVAFPGEVVLAEVRSGVVNNITITLRFSFVSFVSSCMVVSRILFPWILLVVVPFDSAWRLVRVGLLKIRSFSSSDGFVLMEKDIWGGSEGENGLVGSSLRFDQSGSRLVLLTLDLMFVTHDFVSRVARQYGFRYLMGFFFVAALI